MAARAARNHTETLEMLARLAHATGSPLRIAAPGVDHIDLGGAA
jgi:hypothetical protein